MPLDAKILHGGLLCHAPQLADRKGRAKRLRSIMADNRASRQGSSQQLRRPDGEPTSLQIIEDVAEPRYFIHPPQNLHRVMRGEMMQS